MIEDPNNFVCVLVSFYYFLKFGPKNLFEIRQFQGLGHSPHPNNPDKPYPG
jgi:hypothetical protein